MRTFCLVLFLVSSLGAACAEKTPPPRQATASEPAEAMTAAPGEGSGGDGAAARPAARLPDGGAPDDMAAPRPEGSSPEEGMREGSGGG